MFDFYSVSLVSFTVVLYTLFFTMVSFRSVAFQEDRDLRRSRVYLALAFLILGINGTLHMLYGFRAHQPSVGIALDITSYFLVGILFSFVYIPLLDSSYDNNKVRWTHFCLWVATSVCLWVSALFTYGVASKILLTLGGAMCLISCSRIFVAFIRRYHQVSDIVAGETEVDVQSFSRFIFSSVLGLGCTGIAAIFITLLGGQNLQAYVNITTFLLFFHLAMSFINYVSSLK